MIQLALKFGMLKEGYTLEKYLVEAIEKGGYETVQVWGVQGGGKSERCMQMSYWIYRDWDKVLETQIFKPPEFVSTLEAVPDEERIPLLDWEDVGVHYPSSKFKTDIKQYEAIDSTWAAIRTKVNVIVLNIPLIDRLAKNIKDNLTFEVFVGKNQMELINRLFRLPGIGEIESNLFKVTIEEPSQFNLLEVPLEVWKKYWKRRLALTREALANLKGTTDMEDLEGFIPVLEAAKICHEQKDKEGRKINYASSTIQQDISRGILKGKKIAGRLCVDVDDFYTNLELKGGHKPE